LTSEAQQREEALRHEYESKREKLLQKSDTRAAEELQKQLEKVNASHKRDLEDLRNCYEAEIARVEVESEHSTNAEIAWVHSEDHAEIQRQLEEASESHKEELKSLRNCYEEKIARMEVESEQFTTEIARVHSEAHAEREDAIARV
jgi:hypothetical protein